MLDPNTMEVVGKKHFYDHTTLENAKSIARTHNEPPHIERGFGKSTGLIPVIYLHKPAGLKSFQYRAFFQERGIPEVVKDDPMLTGASGLTANLKIIGKVLKNMPN